MSQIRLQPMTAAHFAQFMAALLPPYVAERAAADHVSLDDAERFARKQFAGLLPNGLETPGHQFHSIAVAETAGPVGGVWFHVDAAAKQAFLYNITVFPPWRRRGFATAALALVEESVRANGCASLGLNVFAPNTGAAALYRKLEYNIVSSHMNKRLDRASTVATDPNLRTMERV